VTRLSANDTSFDPRNGLWIGVDRAIVAAYSERQRISALNYCHTRRAFADKRYGFRRNGQAPGSQCLARGCNVRKD
jgi:hypothetical protein